MMRVLVISPERAVFDGEAESVVVCSGATPFMTLLGSGTLAIRHGGATSRFRVQGGFLQVVSNTVRVVAETVQGESDAA